jgi:transcriptional regulator GlxA family with amidase domain
MSTDYSDLLPEHFGFLLVANFSLIAFSSAIEALRMANQSAEKILYKWTVCTLEGTPVSASNGLEIKPDCSVDDIHNMSTFIVCGGIQISDQWTRPMQVALRKVTTQRNIIVGAICTGSYLLAKAGLLNGYKSTIHWENMASMREEFPNAHFTDDLYQIDRDRLTCAGGLASLDMMLNVIGRKHGPKLTTMISELA